MATGDAGIKWPWHEADLSPSSSVEERTNGAIPPFPHMHSRHVQGFYLYFACDKLNIFNLLKPSGNFTYHQV
jgi:hypothetical protein